MKKTLLLSLSTCLLLAGGFRIPEQSLEGIALSASNVANANGANSAYYNPANMVFNNTNKNYFEFSNTFIHLNKVKFKNNNTEVYYSRKEDFIVPQFHFASKELGQGWRIGFSITYPGGLSKKWDDTIPEAGAKEFTLKTVEFNPVIAKKINDNLAFAFGIRFVKSNGIANILGLSPNGDGTYTPLYSEYLNGTSTDRGWNAALSYRYNNDIKFAITYRSKINLSLSGNASGFYNKYLITKNPSDISKVIPFNTNGKVTIPLPAVLNIAIAKKFNKTTLEFVYDRTYWSSYKKLDFDFSDATVNALFGTPKPKNWKDSNTYRFGITHEYSKKITLMAGYAYDKTPIPDSTIDFSLPDSDKHIFSGGIKYKYDNRLSFGFSGLYTKQKKRKASIYDPVTKTYTNGEFSKGGAYILAFGINYAY